jgi:hypothetical protein
MEVLISSIDLSRLLGGSRSSTGQGFPETPRGGSWARILQVQRLLVALNKAD